MASCPSCGKNNAADAVFCTNCGSELKHETQSTIEDHAKAFAQNMEQMGKNLGDSLTRAARRVQEDSEQAGKRLGHRVDHASKSMENWYDRSFGILGPLLSSFLFLIILRIVIEVLRVTVEDVWDMTAVTSVLLAFLLPLFAITLLSNYTSYFAKKSFKFRVFSPLLHAVAFILILWVVAQMLRDLRHRLNIADLGTAAVSLENALPSIFVLVLLIGYVVLALNMPREPEKKP